MKPNFYILSVTATSATLILSTPLNTLKPDEYSVKITSEQCMIKEDDRMKVFSTELVTLTGLEVGCTYFVKIMARNTVAELSSDSATIVNVTTVLSGTT